MTFDSVLVPLLCSMLTMTHLFHQYVDVLLWLNRFLVYPVDPVLPIVGEAPSECLYLPQFGLAKNQGIVVIFLQFFVVISFNCPPLKNNLAQSLSNPDCSACSTTRCKMISSLGMSSIGCLLSHLDSATLSASSNL